MKSNIIHKMAKGANMVQAARMAHSETGVDGLRTMATIRNSAVKISCLGRNPIFILVMASLLLSFLYAPVQAEDCRTVVPEWQWKQELERVKSDFRYPSISTSTINYQIPIAFHIIRKSDGTGSAGPCEGMPPDTLPHPGAFRPGQVDTALADVNSMFAQVGFAFFQYGEIDYIDNDDFYCMAVSGLDIYDLATINSVAEAINVYIAPNTGIGGQSIYWPGTQAILVDAAEAGVPENPTTLAHEIGHYFNLLHTHTIRGFYPGPYTYECPDGSNCETEGDLLCDTPADPNLSGRMDLECNYVLPAVPPPGCDDTPYNPQLNNLMSYAPPICRDLFTPQQIDKMIYTLENERPELAVIIGPIEYTCGDANSDEIVNISDAVFIINYVFLGGSPPMPLESGDTNCDGPVNVSDAVYIINYIFIGGTPPCDINGDSIPDC
jgi:hypothetical protein